MSFQPKLSSAFNVSVNSSAHIQADPPAIKSSQKRGDFFMSKKANSEYWQ